MRAMGAVVSDIPPCAQVFVETKADPHYVLSIELNPDIITGKHIAGLLGLDPARLYVAVPAGQSRQLDEGKIMTWDELLAWLKEVQYPAFLPIRHSLHTAVGMRQPAVAEGR